MQEPPIPDLGTGHATLSLSQLENIARLAADHAVAQALARSPSREEIEALVKSTVDDAVETAVERGLERFLERVGVDPNDKVNLRKDFASLRSSRELKEAMVRHGLLAATGLLVVAMATAVWLNLKGVVR